MEPAAIQITPITQAWVLARLGHNAEALARCHAAIADDPGIPTLLAACEVMRDLGATTEALTVLEAARADHPEERGIDHLIGQLCLTTGELDRAATHLAATLDAWPDAMPGLIGLTILRMAEGRDTEALALWQRGIPVADHPSGMAELGASYFAQNDRPDLARACLDCAVQDAEAPDSSYARASLLGVGDAQRCPPDYVTAYFDRFSETYDATLARLHNTGPDQVSEMLSLLDIKAGAGLRVLDAGCGTGLCGHHLRPVAGYLAGVDLSPGMLEGARARALYDHLGLGDLSLLDQPGTGGLLEGEVFDLITSSDVLVYFGVLDGVLAAYHARLRRGGNLICTLEAASPDEAGKGFVRHPSGRFRHLADYVAGALERAGFTDWQVWQEGTLRNEFGRPVPALLAVGLA